MGDEVRRTQRGNNNAYCQDNEISWFDWALLEQHADIHRFVRELIAIRLGRSAGRRSDDTLQALLLRARVTFHDVASGPTGHRPGVALARDGQRVRRRRVGGST